MKFRAMKIGVQHIIRYSHIHITYLNMMYINYINIMYIKMIHIIRYIYTDMISKACPHTSPCVS